MQQQINQLSQMVSMFVVIGPSPLQSPEAHMAGMVTYSSNLVYNSSKHIWLIDTGVTDHICCSLDFMHNILVLSTLVQLSLPNGSNIVVTKVGSVHVTDKILLHHVLYVPTFHYNLFSVPKWTETTGHLVTFFPDHCTFSHHLDHTILAIGKLMLVCIIYK